MNYSEHEKSCLNLGGQMVSIHNEEENNFLASFAALGSVNMNVRGVAQPRQVYTGLNGEDREWKWKDGSAIEDFHPWQINQPDDMAGQRCGSLTTSNSTDEWYKNWFIGGWDDVDCKYILDGLCQMMAKI